MAGEQDAELVAAEAEGLDPLAGQIQQRKTQGAQVLISLIVTVGIVELLEGVQVHHGQMEDRLMLLFLHGLKGRPQGKTVAHLGPVSYTHLTLPTIAIV